jgi:bacteriocin biosynthesis cyclodehydratase domain-containing protein
MVLKLDPNVPLVWRDPVSLQVGIDPARLVITQISDADERMIAALSTGVSHSGLSMIGHSAGATDGEIARLIARLGDLVVTEEAHPDTRVVAIVGRGPTVDRIASAIAECGPRVEASDTVVDVECDLGITVGQFVLDPETYGFWLRRDQPHLPIVFGEVFASVGPVIEPGAGPCLYCLEYYRRDADVAWPAIASQLWGRHAASETGLVSREVAALASRMTMQRLNNGPELRTGTAASVRICAETGAVTRREWMPHPGCGCIEVPGVLRFDRGAG